MKNKICNESLFYAKLFYNNIREYKKKKYFTIFDIFSQLLVNHMSKIIFHFQNSVLESKMLLKKMRRFLYIFNRIFIKTFVKIMSSF